MALVEVFSLRNKLPFYWRLTTSFDNEFETPNELDFEFTILDGLLSTVRTPELLESLTKVYSLDYNIGYIQEDYDIAQPFVEDFRKFLFKYSDQLNPKANVLEIGCGGAVLLKELKDSGLNCVGVDPSPTALRASEKYGFELVPSFFDSSAFSAKFDLIFHSDVLEHSFDPMEFISDQRKILNRDGIIVVSVPDATENIKHGDISIAMHQHLQYFSADSLRALMMNSGFEILEIRTAGYGGSLYCAARKIDHTKGNIQLGHLDLKTPLPNFQDSVNRFIQLLSHMEGNIGFYVPLRTLPYLCASGIDMKNCNFRFFDDTAHWHGCHFDGTAIPIENFQDIVKNPPDIIFIMSLTFEKPIKEKLLEHFGSQIRLITLRDVLTIE
jgi:2-polyprenyl-3-methyl-5-hydroxy-6-metoxy-1,4-benzoquinol methylase